MSWRTRRVREMATVFNGFPFDASTFSTIEALPLVRIRDITAEAFETFIQPSSAPDSALLRDDDVVIGMDGDFNVRRWNRGTAALNQRVCALRANSTCDPRFLAYALPAHLKVINDLTYATTVKHLASWQVEHISIASPDREDQRAIADFLDEQTSRIDTLIEKQTQLIATLRERRAASTDQVVWRGLNLSASFGPSEVECAPNAPTHWVRTRAKNLLFENDATSVDGEEELLTVSHLTGITPRSEKNVSMTQAESHEGYRLVDTGDLVVNTMWAWMGALGVSRYAGMVSPAYGVYSFREPSAVDTAYYDYFFRSRQFVTEMTRYSRGIWSSRLRLYPEAFLRLPILLPPLSEQREISAQLDQQTSLFDEIIAKTEQHIALAKERRAALITAAVTGQTNVRTAGRVAEGVA